MGNWPLSMWIKLKDRDLGVDLSRDEPLSMLQRSPLFLWGLLALLQGPLFPQPHTHDWCGKERGTPEGRVTRFVLGPFVILFTPVFFAGKPHFLPRL